MIIISEECLRKLQEKHNVTRQEVEQCFMNLRGWFLEDSRLQHRRTPPTQWFIAETNKRRALKIVFQQIDENNFQLISAYEPNEIELAIYAKHGLD